MWYTEVATVSGRGILTVRTGSLFPICVRYFVLQLWYERISCELGHCPLLCSLTLRVRKSYDLRASLKVSLPDRHGLSLVFSMAAPSATAGVDNSKAGGEFPALLCGSNTGTFGEPLPTRTTLDAHTKSSHAVQRGAKLLRVTPLCAHGPVPGGIAWCWPAPDFSSSSFVFCYTEPRSGRSPIAKTFEWLRNRRM